MLHVEKSNDADILASLIKTVHDWHHEHYPEIFKRYSKKRFREYFETCIKDPNQFHFVAFDNTEPIGFVQGCLRTSKGSPFRYGDRLVYVNIVSVDAKYQRKGVAKLLMKSVYALAKKRKIKRVEVDHWEGNQKASSFFTKQTFLPLRQYLFKML